MPRRTPRRVPAGTNIVVGPLRVYVANNTNGKCDTFVIYDQISLGKASNVEEEWLLGLIEDAKSVVHVTDVVTAELSL